MLGIRMLVGLITLVSGCASPNMIESNQDSLLTELKRKGGREAITYLAKNENALERASTYLGQGSREWLEYFPELYSNSDASVSLSLKLALGESIANAPFNAIMATEATTVILKKRGQTDSDQFLPEVCRSTRFDILHHEADSNAEKEKFKQEALEQLTNRQRGLRHLPISEQNHLSGKCDEEIGRSIARWNRY